jgi:hypothetical protein
VVHDGQVIWSDLDDLTTFLVYDFLRIHEYHSIRTDVVQLSAAPVSGLTTVLLGLQSLNIGDGCELCFGCCSFGTW